MEDHLFILAVPTLPFKYHSQLNISSHIVHQRSHCGHLRTELCEAFQWNFISHISVCFLVSGSSTAYVRECVKPCAVVMPLESVSVEDDTFANKKNMAVCPAPQCTVALFVAPSVRSVCCLF